MALKGPNQDVLDLLKDRLNYHLDAGEGDVLYYVDENRILKSKCIEETPDEISLYLHVIAS